MLLRKLIIKLVKRSRIIAFNMFNENYNIMYYMTVHLRL